MIIGITGSLGAGKGEVVKYLVSQKGFIHISARDIWTKELEERGLPVDRDTMTKLANELRAEHGPAYFVEQGLAIAETKPGDYVIESIRAIGEAELLQQEGGILLAVDADQRERYRRITERKSALDNVSYEDFVRQEAAEMENTDVNKQNLGKVMEMADFTLGNNQTLGELHEQIDAILAALEL
jgi:dephospho-CoA kinase